MSGKRDESKGDDKKDVVDLVQEFCLSKNLERDFEDFAIEHSDVFMQAVEFKDDHGEHPLEFYEVYKKYLSKFEGKISDFIIDVSTNPSFLPLNISNMKDLDLLTYFFILLTVEWLYD